MDYAILLFCLYMIRFLSTYLDSYQVSFKTPTDGEADALQPSGARTMINFQVNVPVRMDCMLEMFLPLQPEKTKQGLKAASEFRCPA